MSVIPFSSVAAIQTELRGKTSTHVSRCAGQVDIMMPKLSSRKTLLRFTASAVLALAIGISGAFAQSGAAKAQDQNAKQPSGQQGGQQTSAADMAREQRRVDEFGEAAKAINGPAGNPECVWLGRRVVVLMWRDDLDTAFRHLDLYDRFGCPGGHVQATFRCLVRFGPIDPRQPDSLSGRVHACWINPNAEPQPAAQNAPSTPVTPPAAPAAPTEQKQ